MSKKNPNDILPSIKLARLRSSDEIKEIKFSLCESLINKYKNLKYCLNTYGCQANEADSEFFASVLDSMGMIRVFDYKDSDIVILNTCAIRETAENRIYGELGRLKFFKRKNKNLKIVISGCMPQEEVTIEKIKKTYPIVNLIIGTHKLYNFPEYIDDMITLDKKSVMVFSEQGEITENLPKKRLYKHKAFVSIMYGCDEFCTYCIVPYTRGKERSRNPKEIIKEVKELIKSGCLEITLIGQNVDSYGLDFKEINYKFSNLLEDLAKLDIKRIRFMTSYPRDIDLDTIKVMAKYPNIMPHIHLPIQSGSDTILKKMNRHYSVSNFLEKVKYLREYIPNISITTDIIVAFPGEDEIEFNKTLDIVNMIKFDGAFSFIYSKRAGTPAFYMKNNTIEKDKKERLNLLNETINKIIDEKNKIYKDKTLEVLVDGIKDDIIYGYSKENKIVNIKGGNKDLLGKIVNVKIDETKTFTLYGTIIK